MEARHLRESTSIHCHLGLQNFLFLTADESRLTQINADQLYQFQLYGI